MEVGASQISKDDKIRAFRKVIDRMERIDSIFEEFNESIGEIIHFADMYGP
jgi:hypothetical protein